MYLQLFVIIISLMYQRLKKLLERCNQNPGDLCINYQLKKINLFYDSVHLIKNIRNNLLSYKRFLFPSLTFHAFIDIIDLQSGEMSWKIHHNVFEKDATLDADLRKAPKVTMKVNILSYISKTFS